MATEDVEEGMYTVSVNAEENSHVTKNIPSDGKGVTRVRKCLETSPSLSQILYTYHTWTGTSFP